MTRDSQLNEEVIAELRDEPSLRHERIEVRTENGVVTLNGYVRTFAGKQAADSAVRRVAGVKALTSEIAIRRYATVEVSPAPQGQALFQSRLGPMEHDPNNFHESIAVTCVRQHTDVKESAA